MWVVAMTASTQTFLSIHQNIKKDIINFEKFPIYIFLDLSQKFPNEK